MSAVAAIYAGLDLGDALAPARRVAAPAGFAEAPLWDPFEACIGPYFVQETPGGLVTTLQVDDRHLIAETETCAPGVVLAFADASAATVAWLAAGRRNGVTVATHATWLGAARRGDWLVHRTGLVTVSGRNVSTVSELATQNGMVAIINSQWKIV